MGQGRGPLLTPYALRALPAELAGAGNGGKGLPAGAAAAFECALVASARAAATAAAKDDDDEDSEGKKKPFSLLLPRLSAERESELLASARMAWAGLKRTQQSGGENGSGSGGV